MKTVATIRRFYFDYNATTPVSPEVLEAMLPVLTESFGNASSVHHYGQAAKQKLEESRRDVASWLGVDAREIVFTSGGTEADNLALFGAVRAAAKRPAHVITTTIEHPAVLNACAQLEREGAAVTYVEVDGGGSVDPGAIRRAIRPDTVLISVMHVNNETGVVQPIGEISEIAREAGVLLHSDGVQAAARLGPKPRELGVDLYSISGHKLYAPKGVGALYVRKGTRLEPLFYGGRHERDRRAGTENVAGVAAFARAARWLAEHQNEEAARLKLLRDRLERAVVQEIPWARVNCAASPRIGNTSNMLFEGIESEPMLIALDLKGIAVSSGAACSSGAVEPSHVLLAMGLSKQDARSCLRISLGRFNDDSQVDMLIDAVCAAAAHLKRIAPVHA